MANKDLERLNTPDCDMVSMRDVRISSTLGHTIYMKAEVPMRVPGPLVDIAAEQGCIPSNSKEYEAFKQKLSTRAAAEKMLTTALVTGIAAMVKRNKFEEFTPSGHPKIDVLAKEIGVETSAITEQMRDHAFSQWREINRNSIQARQRSKEPPAAPAVEVTTEEPPAEQVDGSELTDN